MTEDDAPVPPASIGTGEPIRVLVVDDHALFRREGYLRGRLPGLPGTRVDDVAYGLLAADLALVQTASERMP